MGSVTEKRFCDCFVNFDGGRLILGNSRFVREFDLSKNLLHTVSMRKSDGTVVASESSAPSDFYFYGDRCIPEQMSYQTPHVGACVVDSLYGSAPYLHVTVSLYEAFQQLTLRKDFYIYPELPALAMRCRIVSPVVPLAVWNCRRPVRARYQSRARSGLVFEGCVDRISPAKAQKYTVPQGYHDGSGTVQIDSTEQAKLIPSNIRDGVTILGVEGTMSGSEGVKPQNKTVTPTTSEQTVLPDDTYTHLSQVTVLAIPYVESDNSAGGKTVTIG